MSRERRPSKSPVVSRAWKEQFEANLGAADGLPWDDTYRLTPSEWRAIEKSVQQFQLGEGAQGRRLMARARAFAKATGDALFPEALRLFIREEQRHSGQLLRFMRAQGIPSVAKHWVDSVFRRVRVLAGLELELRVLVTAEVIAVPYYRALGRATRSELLRSISDRILREETEHLRFQASMLSRIETSRLRHLRRLVWKAHRWFLIGTCCVVWTEHQSVFLAAGISFGGLLALSLSLFSGLERAAHSCECPMPISYESRMAPSKVSGGAFAGHFAPQTAAAVESQASELR